MYKILTAIAICVLLAFGAYVLWFDRAPEFETSDVPAVSFDEVVNDVEIIKVIDEEQPDEIIDDVPVIEDAVETDTETIPLQMNLAVPFTSQAPSGNWSLPYQEACEEASAYMVSEYFAGTPEGKINPLTADSAILEAVSFEEDFLGIYLDTTALETVQFIDAYFGYQATVVENPTVEQIKAEIAAGRPVIVPAAGRELGNPNFTGLGPLYHMLVIKGYTETTFITNDPGTRNGENYVYNIQVLMNAIGDWNNGDPANGASVAIFTGK